MGVGIIGVSSGAAEALPFGAASLITSGFVNGLTYDYTATVNPGRYIIEGSTRDGDSPIVAYAPNSNTTAIAYPGKSAILNVTSAETVIKLSAIPVVGTIGGPLRAGHWTANGVGYYRNLAGAENTDGSILVDSVYYYTGATWYNEIYTSTDSGVNWSNTFSNANGGSDPRPIEFIPDNGGYFLMGQNNNVWRSTNGTSWSQIANVSAINDFFNVGGGEVLMATNSGIFRSTNHGQNWTQVYSQSSIFGFARIESNGNIVAFNTTNFVYSTDRQNWNRNGSINWANQQNVSFQSYYGIAALRHHAVIANLVWPSSSITGAGFTLLDRFANPIATTYQGELAFRGNTDNEGPEYRYLVKMYENRGFILSIGLGSGFMYLSTDGYSWTEIGKVAGFAGYGISSAGNANVAPPKLQGNKLLIPTQMTGGPAKYTNAFAYKIFASAI